jgi:hypothetical protein
VDDGGKFTNTYEVIKRLADIQTGENTKVF